MAKNCVYAEVTIFREKYIAKFGAIKLVAKILIFLKR